MESKQPLYPVETETEIWEDIPGFEGFYQASNLGNIKSVSRAVNTGHGVRMKIGKNLTPTQSKRGYYRVSLSCAGSTSNFMVHRLIAMTFIPNKHNKPEVNHKNCVKSDNRVNNLEWSTRIENVSHAVKMGQMHGNQSRKGKRVPYNGLPKILLDVENGIFYNSTEAGKLFGISKRQLLDRMNSHVKIKLKNLIYV